MDCSQKSDDLDWEFLELLNGIQTEKTPTKFNMFRSDNNKPVQSIKQDISAFISLRENKTSPCSVKWLAHMTSESDSILLLAIFTLDNKTYRCKAYWSC